MKSLTGCDIPSYDSDFTVETAQPGLYLGLFHGRSSPDQQLSDWGVDGPVIGPLHYCHCTYACELKLGFYTADDRERYFPREIASWKNDGMGGKTNIEYSKDAQLSIEGDMVRYGDMWYGDWTCFTMPNELMAKPAPSATPEEISLLKLALGALNTAPRFDVPSNPPEYDDSYKLAAAIQRAIPPHTEQTDALHVIACTAHIRDYLKERDPNALRQVLKAIPEPIRNRVCRELLAELHASPQAHLFVGTGYCNTCGHYGDDCTGVRPGVEVEFKPDEAQSRKIELHNFYRCDDCETGWDDTASAALVEPCPTCGKEFAPFETKEIT